MPARQGTEPVQGRGSARPSRQAFWPKKAHQRRVDPAAGTGRRQADADPDQVLDMERPVGAEVGDDLEPRRRAGFLRRAQVDGIADRMDAEEDHAMVKTTGIDRGIRRSATSVISASHCGNGVCGQSTQPMCQNRRVAHRRARRRGRSAPAGETRHGLVTFMSIRRRAGRRLGAGVNGPAPQRGARNA